MNKKRKSVRHNYDVDIHKRIEKKVFHDQLNKNWLPQFSLLPEDEGALVGVAALMNQLISTSFIVEDPVYHLKCFVNADVGPTAAYLIASGRYSQSLLSACYTHLSKDDAVLHIGAGLGLSTVLEGLCTKQPVVAVEPYTFFHPILRENALLNDVSIVIQSGCIVPGERGGETPFFVDDDIWCSSLYPSARQQETLLNVPIFSLEYLIKTHSPTVLVFDAPGTYLSLITENISLGGIAKIFVNYCEEFFTEQVARKNLLEILSNAGLFVSDVVDDVWFFSRIKKAP